MTDLENVLISVNLLADTIQNYINFSSAFLFEDDEELKVALDKVKNRRYIIIDYINTITKENKLLKEQLQNIK